MEINLKIEDAGENKVILSSDLNPDDPKLKEMEVTPALVYAIGIRLLWESGDVVEAGMIAYEAISQGRDPMAMAREVANQRRREREEASK